MNHDEAIAHALAAEKRWMQLLSDGSCTLAEAAELMDPSTPDPVRILALHKADELLAFQYGRAVVPEVSARRRYGAAGHSAAARDAGATDVDLALWMFTDSALLTGQGTPADHLADAAQVIEAAHIHFEAVW